MLCAFAGRVEFMWSFLQVLITLFLWVTLYVSNTGGNVILLLLTLGVSYNHIQMLPYHKHHANLFRGGIYTTCIWFFGVGATSSGIQLNGVTEANKGLVTTIQWVAIASSPVLFLFGNFLVHMKREKLSRQMDKLHGECELQLEIVNSKGRRKNDTKNTKHDDVDVVMSTPAAVKVVKRTQLEAYFDSRWETKRCFSTSLEASAAARTLLARREERSLKFLNHIIKRGLVEHPDSDGLVILQIRFTNPIPYTLYLYPTSYTQHPIPYTLYPVSYILHPTSYILWSIPYTQNSIPYTLRPIPCTLYPILYTLYPVAYILYSLPVPESYTPYPFGP
jgi:hypothetical protein